MKTKKEIIRATSPLESDFNTSLESNFNASLESDIIRTKDDIEKNISPILINQIKNNAYNGDKNSILIYLKYIEDTFIKEYNSFSNHEDKEKYLKNNLDDFEEEYYNFIDDKKDENKQIIKEGDKKLYKNIGLFYEKIGDYGRAVSSYTDCIRTLKGGYKLYSQIAEIYLTNKINISLEFRTNLDIAKENYSLLLQYAEENEDIENYILALEKLGDIILKETNNKDLAETYYVNALNNGNKNNALTKKQTERLSLKIIKTSNTEETIHNTLVNLIKIDYKYLLTIATYNEEKGNIVKAFFHYIQAYQYRDVQGNCIIQDSKDAIIIFIEGALKDKITNDYKKYVEEFKGKAINQAEEELLLEINNNEYIAKNELLSIIIKHIDNHKMLPREYIASLFEISIGDSFYTELTINDIENYIFLYENNIVNSDIYLHRILKTITDLNGDGNNSLIKELLKNIYNKRKLDDNDKNFIKEISNNIE